MLFWKAPIVRGSLDTAPRLALGSAARRMPGLLTGLCALGALGLGLGWTIGLLQFDSFGGYSPLNVHVELGLLLLPLLAWHLSRRWERRPALPALLARRRTLAQLGVLTLGTLAGWRIVDALIAEMIRARRAAGVRLAAHRLVHRQRVHRGDLAVRRRPVDRARELAPQRRGPAGRQHDVDAGRPGWPPADNLRRAAGLHRRLVDRAALDRLAPGRRPEARWPGRPRRARRRGRSRLGYRPPLDVPAARVSDDAPGDARRRRADLGRPRRARTPGGARRRGFQWVKWVDQIAILPAVPSFRTASVSEPDLSHAGPAR